MGVPMNKDEGDEIDNLLSDIERKSPGLRRTRTNHTFSLDTFNSAWLVSYCKESGVTASAVIDRLIVMFMEKAKAKGKVQKETPPRPQLRRAKGGGDNEGNEEEDV